MMNSIADSVEEAVLV